MPFGKVCKMSVEAFEYRVREPPDSFGIERASFLYPSTLEMACWHSFIAPDHIDPTASEEKDIDYVSVRHRCEHLVPSYPSGNLFIRMQLIQLSSEHATLLFEHFTENTGGSTLVICSEMTIACIRRFGTRSLPAEWPEDVRGRLVALRVADRTEGPGTRSYVNSGILRIFHRWRRRIRRGGGWPNRS